MTDALLQEGALQVIVLIFYCYRYWHTVLIAEKNFGLYPY